VTSFVVCSACGTRIKAGRPHCLRCFEPLPLPGAPSRPSIFEALTWSSGTKVMAGAAALLTALSLVIIWQTSPQGVSAASRSAPVQAPTATAAARPGPAAAPAPAAQEQPEPVRPANGDEPFLDTPSSPSDGDGAVYRETWDHFKLARSAADEGKWTRAIQEYSVAARLSRSDAAAQYNLALAFHRRGDERDAIATFHKALALAPDAAAFRLPLAAAYENVGQFADAAREYRAFVAAAPESRGAERARSRIEALSTGSSGAGGSP
jgi:tetratricopeptide (TPR) repeat protein